VPSKGFGGSNHGCGDLAVPDNIMLFHPIRRNSIRRSCEKIFKNKLKQAIFYIERNPKLVRSITLSPILPTHPDVEMVSELSRAWSGVNVDQAHSGGIRNAQYRKMRRSA
jgi:hypothetical protein